MPLAMSVMLILNFGLGMGEGMSLRVARGHKTGADPNMTFYFNLGYGNIPKISYLQRVCALWKRGWSGQFPVIGDC